MASKVEVLCPNGHRVTVKITPNTKLLQILEEACTKQGFHPPEDYELKRNNRCLDMALSVRFAGLPNLAKLDLMRASRTRAETDVMVVLHLETGERLQHPFSPAYTLWKLLEHWEQAANRKLLNTEIVDAHPICIFMREEIIGEYALKERSLRSLGLTSGSAVIRFVHRAVDNEKLAASREAIDREKARIARLGTKMATTKKSENPTPVSRMDVDENEAVASCDPTPVAEEPMESDVLLVAEVQNSPHEVQHLPSEVQMPPLLPEAPSCNIPQPMDTTRATSSEHVKPSSKSRHRHLASPVTKFKFPEESKGKNLYQNEMCAEQATRCQPCDRREVVYSLDETKFASSSAACEELPNEFFEVTRDDVKKMWASLQAKVHEEQPLMTSSMRLAMLEDRMSSYEHAVLRVVFPDRIVLQGLFRPRETVYAVEKFIKGHLEDKNMPFYLFTAPPKCILNDKAASLIEAELVPMAIVYFGSSTKKEHYLASSAMKNVSSQQSATDLLNASLPASQMETSHSSDINQPGPSQPRVNRPQKQQQSHSNTTSVPKWFKIGKK